MAPAWAGTIRPTNRRVKILLVFPGLLLPLIILVAATRGLGLAFEFLPMVAIVWGLFAILIWTKTSIHIHLDARGVTLQQALTRRRFLAWPEIRTVEPTLVRGVHVNLLLHGKGRRQFIGIPLFRLKRADLERLMAACEDNRLDAKFSEWNVRG